MVLFSIDHPVSAALNAVSFVVWIAAMRMASKDTRSYKWVIAMGLPSLFIGGVLVPIPSIMYLHWRKTRARDVPVALAPVERF